MRRPLPSTDPDPDPGGRSHRLARGLLAALTLSVIPACATTPTAGSAVRGFAPAARSAPRPVATPGPQPVASGTLAGRWVGAYSARTYGRTGPLEVTLAVDGTTVTGAILLAGVPALDVRSFGAARTGRPETRDLRVPLARATIVGTDVRLESEPYWDSACGCTDHPAPDRPPVRRHVVGAPARRVRGDRGARERRPLAGGAQSGRRHGRALTSGGALHEIVRLSVAPAGDPVGPGRRYSVR